MCDITNSKVSIIIPVYNSELYLSECIESVVCQSYKNKEVIIIDDGSTDSSAEIISKFENKYSEIVVITTVNCGQSSARNTGVERANGEYIIFLDSDDWFEKDTLERCLIALKESDADIALFNGVAFADGMPESVLKKFSYTRPLHLVGRKMLCRDVFSESIKASNYIVQPCCYMYRKAAFNGVCFFSGIFHEDNLFTTRLLIENKDATAICLPERFLHRRVRPDSIMTQIRSVKHVDGYFAVAEELLKSELKDKSCATAKALNIFIQNMICNAIFTAHAAFNNKMPSHIRRKSYNLLFKLKIRRLKFKAVLICFFPQIISVKRTLQGILEN